MKFIYRNDKKKDEHWKQCEKKHAPFIELNRINNEYVNIFYDVTNYQLDLNETSNNIKELYSIYVEFFMFSEPMIKDLYGQYYFFNFIVKSEHAEFLAEKLYDYLLFRLNG
ncbi:hypothetical protein WKS79_004230 [Providencia stuartii]